MIKLFFSIGFAVSTLIANAQLADTDKTFSLKIKDTAYSRFRTELDSWIKKASGRNTYTTEVRSLFERSKPMLARMNKQYDGHIPVNRMTVSKPVSVLKKPSKEILKILNEMQVFAPEKPILISDSWMYHDLTNPMLNSYPLNSHYEEEKISYTVRETFSWQRSICQSQRGFFVKIEVPNHPEVIFARVKFDYTFEYTGWDTRGGKAGINLILAMNPEAKSAFRSETLINWTDTVVTAPVWKFRQITYHIVDNLLPFDSIPGEFGEVHASKQGSVYAEGYVKPNTNFDVGIGFAYMKDSYYGLNGLYLYGEFLLKKATVTFYRKKPD